MIYLILIVIIILIIIHATFLMIFNYMINPYEPSIFTKIFPYFFLHNLIFSKSKLNRSYFSIRVDINTSEENVKKHNKGLLNLLKIANKHDIPLTFSIVADYIPPLSNKVIEEINNNDHEVISHGLKHEDITDKDQFTSIQKSKQILEDNFDQKVQGFIGPQGKHDMETLKAAKKNDIKYLSSGALSYLRYWSFPYPFKKKGIWLLGGTIKSDYQLYVKEKVEPKKALDIWKEAIDFRSKKGWYTQLEYHNSSTTEEQLEALEELFKYIKKKVDLETITQSELVEEVK